MTGQQRDGKLVGRAARGCLEYLLLTVALTPLVLAVGAVIFAVLASGSTGGDPLRLAPHRCSVKVVLWADCSGRYEDAQPLAGVCAWCSAEPDSPPPDAAYCQRQESQTNQLGVWTPSSACHYIIVQPMAGLKPASAPAQRCDGIFGLGVGLVSESCPDQHLQTPADMARQKLLKEVALGVWAVWCVGGVLVLYRVFRSHRS